MVAIKSGARVQGPRAGAGGLFRKYRADFQRRLLRVMRPFCADFASGHVEQPPHPRKSSRAAGRLEFLPVGFFYSVANLGRKFFHTLSDPFCPVPPGADWASLSRPFYEINIPCFRAGVKCENQSFFNFFFTSPLFHQPPPGYGFPHFHEINIPCFRAGVKCENQSFFNFFFTSPLFHQPPPGYGFPHFHEINIPCFRAGVKREN
jgi:hypothetical protein